MLEAGIPAIVVENFLGQVSLQTTLIYIEVTQDTMDRQSREWNNKWFVNDNSEVNQKDSINHIPAFLK